MNDDTISRAAAFDFIDSMNWCDEISDEAFKKITIHLENLPSAQPGWIPCKTKLPEKDGSYLVTANNGQMAIYLFVKGMSENYWKQWGATAWMPLPTPYREGGLDNG